MGAGATACCPGHDRRGAGGGALLRSLLHGRWRDRVLVAGAADPVAAARHQRHHRAHPGGAAGRCSAGARQSGTTW